MQDAESAAQWAWAAGLFEGEGCIGKWKHPHSPYPLIRLQIIMTDRDVLEKFCAVVECGKVSAERRSRQPNRKPSFQWLISNRKDVERILLMFRPWLCERRRAKADEVLAEIAQLDRVCRHCGVAFRAHRHDTHFCSKKCRGQWNYLQNRPVATSPTGRPRTLGVTYPTA